MTNQAVDEIGKALTQVFETQGWLMEPVPDFDVTHPKDDSYGDYTTNVAMVLAKNLGKNPRELAQEIVTNLQNDIQKDSVIDMVKTNVAGQGFINFYLKDGWLMDELTRVDHKYGRNDIAKGKLAIVEYSSPNIAKPFTIGHLRSTVIGDAVANLLEANGWKVLRDNHLGDWGTQFGKQIAAIKRWGSIEAIGKSDNPVKELVALYVKFHEEAEKNPELEDEARAWFKKLEDGDQEARSLWKMCIEWSWKEFSRIYNVLGVHHSQEFEEGRGLGESFFEDKMIPVLEILKTKEWFKSGKEGAQLVFFPGDKYPPAMIVKKDGATLYHTRDLATDKYRMETYKPDLIVNEVGAEQQLYFQQLFEIEKMLGWFHDGQRVHVMHGMYRFREGKMSTRKGNVIWLEDVLEEAIKRAAKIRTSKIELPMFEISQSFDDSDTKPAGTGRKPTMAEALDRSIDSKNAQIGIGALKWNDLKGEARRDIVFDWDEILTMKGNSGPYVQYTYARTQAVLRKAGDTRVKPLYLQGTELDDAGRPCNHEELAILRWLYRYPEVVMEAGQKFAPHLVAQYLYELASRYNAFYNKHQIVGGESEQVRVEITSAVANVLKNGLELLGIVAPKEM